MAPVTRLGVGAVSGMGTGGTKASASDAGGTDATGSALIAEREAWEGEGDRVLAVPPLGRALVPTGIAVAIPEGWEGQVRPRSGLAIRHGVTCLNSPGTIDADYRGEIRVILVNLGDAPFSVRRGDRIAQIVFAPVVKAALEVVDDLEATRRGEGGFGHTG